MRGKIFLAAAALVATGSAFAAPLDGVWSARIAPDGSCGFGGELTLNLANDQISGAIEDPDGTEPVQGFLNAGIGSIRLGSSVGLARFDGNQFRLDYRADCGLRHVEGARIPDSAAENRAAYDERKRLAEARYTELVGRAMQGDLTIDFKALRMAYPFTSRYDPARISQASMQALLSFNANDCADALAKSQTGLVPDFTNMELHSLRAQCFEKTGNAPQAVAERTIEKGLADSVRAGADGRTAVTAYAVVSYREEFAVMDALGLSDISPVLSLWGVNHRRYDLIQGSSRATGRSQIVWFDAELMVEGLTQFQPQATP